MKKYLGLILLLSIGIISMGCGDTPKAESPEVLQNPNDTPTEAYKRLFAAVKSKNTGAIKEEFSKNSIAAAEAQAARMKISVEEVYKNGFTRTTFAETLPEIRDERVKGKMGAVEVWNAHDSVWEDLPFIREASGWKLAVGDVFAGNWKRPGKGRAATEHDATNTISGNKTMVNGLPNINTSSSVNMNTSR